MSFVSVRGVFQSYGPRPILERAKLLTITEDDDAGRTLNENFRKLNGFLFGDLDYAAIATK